MDVPKAAAEHGPTLRKLYPQLNEEQLQDAEANLERYLELALRIYERLQIEAEASQSKPLTESAKNPTLQDERSNPSVLK